MHGSVQTAFLLTLLAGLCTGLGSLVVVLARKPSLRLLSFGLGFSGGVMVFVSLAELLPQAQRVMGNTLGGRHATWLAYASFFGGILFSRLLDALVPEAEKNPHEVVPVLSLDRIAQERPTLHHTSPLTARQTQSLARVGLLTTAAIAIHNFPEGMATLVTSLADTSLGLSVAVAVAIHNIPEGISVAVLVFFATRSRSQAAVFSLLAGLTEPLGAAVFYLLFARFLDTVLVGCVLAAVGGVMVFISFDELLPTAREYDTGHMEITGIVSGMAVMAASLALF